MTVLLSDGPRESHFCRSGKLLFTLRFCIEMIWQRAHVGDGRSLLWVHAAAGAGWRRVHAGGERMLWWVRCGERALR